jgi:hypothetical protein
MERGMELSSFYPVAQNSVSNSILKHTMMLNVTEVLKLYRSS